MPSLLDRMSDLCKRSRCWIACCGGTIVVIEKDDASSEEEEKPVDTNKNTKKDDT